MAEFQVPSGNRLGTVPAHTHETGEVNGLETALANKAAKGHTHAVSDVSGLAAELTTLEEQAAAAKAAAAAAKAAADAMPVYRAGENVTFSVDETTGDTVIAVTAAGGENIRIEAGNNVSFTKNTETGATVINAAGGGGTVQEYFVNGKAADADGNFTVTAAEIGASPTGHTHAIADIKALQEALDSKSAWNHTHQLVNKIIVGNAEASGTVTLAAGDNVSLTAEGGVITVNVNANNANAGTRMTSVTDSNGGSVVPFVGTRAEWEAFTPAAGIKYLVFILEENIA